MVLEQAHGRLTFEAGGGDGIRTGQAVLALALRASRGAKRCIGRLYTACPQSSNHADRCTGCDWWPVAANALQHQLRPCVSSAPHTCITREPATQPVQHPPGKLAQRPAVRLATSGCMPCVRPLVCTSAPLTGTQRLPSGSSTTPRSGSQRVQALAPPSHRRQRSFGSTHCLSRKEQVGGWRGGVGGWQGDGASTRLHLAQSHSTPQYLMQYMPQHMG